MGAWGTGPFENDIAADWVLEADAADDARAFVIEACTTALETDDLDDGSADVAYAAAAWLVGPRQRDDGGPSMAPPALDATVRDVATRGLRRMIADGSPWLELWVGSDDEIVEQVTAILQRLEAS